MKGAGALLLAIVFCASPARGQSNISTGEIKGIVADTSGAVIPEASVTVTNPTTGFLRTILTDERGEYRFLTLPPGSYDILVEKTDFATAVRESVQVFVGQSAIFNFDLQLGPSNLKITVTDEPPLVESTRAQQSNTVSEFYVRNLPIDRRDYLTFTLLMPGIADSTAIADNTDFRVPTAPHSGLSFYGSNGRGNSVTVDGAEANDGTGGVRPTLSQEAVQEFEINRSNYSAELGGASGGVINIVSKSGTNDVHGAIFGFFRHHALDAADPFATALEGDGVRRIKPPAKRQQYGGTISAPIKKGRTFLFGAFEKLNRDEFSAVTVLTDKSIFQPTPAQAGILDTLAANTSTAPIPCLSTLGVMTTRPPADCAAALRAALTSPENTVALFRSNSGVFPFTTDSNAFSVRIDQTQNGRDHLFFRYNYTNLQDSNQSTRALVGLTRSSLSDVLDSTTVGGWTHLFSPHSVNEARLQWNYRHFVVTPNDLYGPELNINGFGFFNRDFTLPTSAVERRYEAVDNMTFSRNTHRLKLGAALLTRGDKRDVHAFFGGRLSFGSLPGSLVSPALGSVPLTALQAFNLGLPQSFQMGQGSPTVAGINPFYAFYVQDTWDLPHGLTLNYGIRYELDQRRKPLPTDKNNFAPRFGFAWDLGGSKKTVARGGFGIFYSPTYYQIDWVVQALNEIDGFRQIAQVLTTPNTSDLQARNGPANIFQTLRSQGVIRYPTSSRSIAPADLAQFGIAFTHQGPRAPLTVLFREEPNYRNSYSEQGSFGIERELAAGLGVSADYIFTRTLKISRARDVNILPRFIGSRGIHEWTAASGCTGAGLSSCFRDPLLLQDNIYESSARAFYHGLTVEVKKRLSQRFNLGGNYTWSKAIDEVTDFNSDFQANDQTNVRAERALSAFDERHKFVIYSSLQGLPSRGPDTPWFSRIVADFAVTPIFRANSSRPFNLLAGVDVNGDRHSTTDRPPFAGRNTGIGPNFWTLDLRLTRRLPIAEGRNLEFIFEAFNLFNRLNFASVNNTVGPNFTGPFRVAADRELRPSDPLGFTSAFDPRRIQLGFRLNL